MIQEFESDSSEATRTFGERLGNCLQPGDIVLLFGDLGAGKTTLTQGLCRGLGVPENEYVRSPTFTLVNQYPGRLPVFHIDLYRMESLPEVENLGLDDVFNGNGVCLVEWAEKLFHPTCEDGTVTPFDLEPRLEIRIEIQSETHRKISLIPVSLSPQTHPLFSLQ